jgi:DNA-binding GntR family transcriptional regulator
MASLKSKPTRGSSTKTDTLALGYATRRVSDQVYLRLRAAIVRGHFEPGARLVERDLTSRFEVSRTPIREALKRLEHDGLVVCRPHCAYSVRSPHFEEAALAYEARGILEGACSALAAERATAAQIARLGGLVRKGRRMLKNNDFESLLLCNNELHALQAEASHNSFLVEEHRRVWTYVDLLRGRFWSSTDRPHVGQDEHEQIVDAIASHNPELARQLGAEHVKRAWEGVSTRIHPKEVTTAAS